MPISKAGRPVDTDADLDGGSPRSPDCARQRPAAVKMPKKIDERYGRLGGSCSLKLAESSSRSGTARVLCVAGIDWQAL
jgi:hypothetical protein